MFSNPFVLRLPLRSCLTVLVLGAAGWAGTVAHAAGNAAPAGCTANEAANDPAACRRESGAALQEGKRGGLTTPGAAAGANARDRCDALAGSQKTDCLSRAGSTSAAPDSRVTTEGSVQSGGILKETVTPVPAKR